ncbi:hypothetical protein [Bacillus sp. 166amftsu]|uniref:hypothetical protein n=1 Tax=Bacillus sp. 166amftsu TaxID=1761753 RepID=UPI0008948E12|nr:hypothetical protein [Bacillus sp. 166amftsu]SDY37748.1 hypothetical protein SAMN04488156_10183 [Bacillus sp. 166amftsu]
MHNIQIKHSNVFKKLFDLYTRGYWGFHDRGDGKFEPTIVLGSGLSDLSPGVLTVSNTINPNNVNNNQGSIGMVSSIVNNTYDFGAGLTFIHKNDSAVLRTKGVQEFRSGFGAWYFSASTNTNVNDITISDTGNDTELRLANCAIRNSRITGYTTDLQIMAVTGGYYINVLAKDYKTAPVENISKI